MARPRTQGLADHETRDAEPAPGPEAADASGELADSPGAREAHVAGCLDGLSASARQLVEVGAVFGSSFAVGDVSELMGQPAGALLAAVQEAVDAGALVPRPETLEFRYEMIRRVAYQAVPAAVRLALHRQIGELLIQRRNWTAAADHLMHGVEAGDPVAATALDRVACEVRASTPECASELALRALALTDTDDADRFARTSTAVRNLVTAGRLADASYLAHKALRTYGVQPPAAARLRLALAELHLFSGRFEAAVDEIRPVLSDPAVPASLHALAELCLLWAELALDDRVGAAAQVAAILAGGAGRDETLPPALAALGLLAWRDGLAANGLALARSAVQRGDREPGAAGGPFSRLCLAWMLTALGELEDATQLIDAARDEITACGETLWSAGPAIAAATVDLAAGRLDDASAQAHAAIDVATELGTSCFVSRANTVLAELALMRGELSEAEAHLERCPERTAWPPWRMSGPRVARAMVADAKGGPERVLADAADVYDEVAVDARVLLDDPLRAAWLVRTGLAAGDKQRAADVVAQAERLAALNASLPAIVAGARHAQGLFRADPELLQQAGAAHRTLGAQASAWEDAGAALLGTDDRPAAKDLLERAVVAYEQLGAEQGAARVRSRLRAIGVRWRHGRRAERPVSGWDSLTDTERAVTEHVAEGLTNAQVAERMYLSRHTVDFNLRQIFRKLGIRSRVALAREYLERRGGTDTEDHVSVRCRASPVVSHP